MSRGIFSPDFPAFPVLGGNDFCAAPSRVVFVLSLGLYSPFFGLILDILFFIGANNSNVVI